MNLNPHFRVCSNLTGNWDCECCNCINSGLPIVCHMYVKSSMRDWRDGLSGKSTGWSSKGPGLSSQQPHGYS